MNDLEPYSFPSLEALFFKETMQVWETRFKTVYGQPPAPTATESAASKLSNILQLPSLFRPSRSNSTASFNTLQIPDDGDTDSIGGISVSDSMSFGGSEPSTHNSVLALRDHDSTARRKSRESSVVKKVNKQVRRERALSAPGAVSLARTRSTGSSATAASEIEHPFLKQVPEDGVGAVGFAALGAAGWDLWGPRDAHVLDGTQNRGDCCTVSWSPSNTVQSGTNLRCYSGRDCVLREHNQKLDPHSGLGAEQG